MVLAAQRGGASAERALNAVPRRVVTPLVQLEVQAALARLVRDGALAPSGAEEGRDLCQHLVDRGVLHEVPITARHWRRAQQLVRQSVLPLRALDSIHAAVAIEEGCTLLTADRPLARAVTAMGGAVRVI